MFVPTDAAQRVARSLTKDHVVALGELQAVLTEDLLRRAAWIRDVLGELVTEGAPADRIIGAILWTQFWDKHGADEVLMHLDEQRLDRRPNEHTDADRAAAQAAYDNRFKELMRAFQPQVSVETIREIEGLAPRLSSAKDMAALLSRYRMLDIKTTALERAARTAASGWDEYIQRQIDIARGK